MPLPRLIEGNLPHALSKRIQAHGVEGRDWLASLPGMVDTLSARWQCEPVRIMSGGSESLVLEASRENDTAIMKIGLPGSCDCSHEAHVLALAPTSVYVEVYAHDAEHNALLLEQLGPSLDSMRLPADSQFEVLCTNLEQAWIPLPADHGLMTGAAKANWLADFIDNIWRELKPERPDTIRDQAREFAYLRAAAHIDKTSVLVHGDAHEFNTLANPDNPGRFKFVDPDGLCAEPACDLAVLMRGWNAELLKGDPHMLARMRCDKLASLTGVDPGAIWQWGFMERVSTGLLLLHIGLTQEANEMLDVAEALVEQ